MSPQQKAQLQARLAQQALERAQYTVVDIVPSGPTTFEAPVPYDQVVDMVTPMVVDIHPEMFKSLLRSSDRHKGSRTEYFREQKRASRAKQKAK